MKTVTKSRKQYGYSNDDIIIIRGIKSDNSFKSDWERAKKIATMIDKHPKAVYALLKKRENSVFLKKKSNEKIFECERGYTLEEKRQIKELIDKYYPNRIKRGEVTKLAEQLNRKATTLHSYIDIIRRNMEHSPILTETKVERTALNELSTVTTVTTNLSSRGYSKEENALIESGIKENKNSNEIAKDVITISPHRTYNAIKQKVHITKKVKKAEKTNSYQIPIEGKIISKVLIFKDHVEIVM